MKKAFLLAIVFVSVLILFVPGIPAQGDADYEDDGLLPDLTISGMIYVNTGEWAVAGDVATIDTTIRNIGDVSAYNVTVILRIDGDEAGRVVLKVVDTDTAANITFTWVMEEGKHKVTIEIDPENTIEEINDQTVNVNNNVKSRDYTTPDYYIDEDDDDDSTSVGPEPRFCTIGMIAAASLVCLVLYKRKHPTP